MNWKKKITSLLLTGAIASGWLIQTAWATDYEGVKRVLNFPEAVSGYALVSQADYMVVGDETFLSEYDVYEPDSEGNIIKRFKYYEADENAPITSSYEYDNKGRVTKIQSADGALTLTYNDAGDMIKGELVKDNGTVSIDEYQYDSNHNVTQAKLYDMSNGSVVEGSTDTVLYTNNYDNRDRLISASRVENGSEQTNYSYEYDSNNRLVRQYTAEAPDSPITYEYDWAGNRTKANTYVDDRLEGYTIYTYEKLGEVTPTVTKMFTDVENTWYANAVQSVYDQGLMSGTAPRTFEPNSSLTRAMIAQILYKNADSPQVTATSQFLDVDQTQWYAKAIAWVAQQNIASGYEDGNFGVSDNVTREQLAVMLYRAAGSPKVSNSLDFADASSVSAWAVDSMKWAVKNGIVSGAAQDDSTALLLNPQGQATRAQTAVMLTKYITIKK